MSNLRCAQSFSQGCLERGIRPSVPHLCQSWNTRLRRPQLILSFRLCSAQLLQDIGRRLAQDWRHHSIFLIKLIITNRNWAPKIHKSDQRLNNECQCCTADSADRLQIRPFRTRLHQGTAASAKSRRFVNKCLRSPCNSQNEGISWSPIPIYPDAERALYPSPDVCHRRRVGRRKVLKPEKRMERTWKGLETVPAAADQPLTDVGGAVGLVAARLRAVP